MAANPFDADDRMQSEDRGHRPGMDLNKGLTIVDLIHLPSDQLVLDNLKKKVKLQSLTLDDISKVFNDFVKGTQDEMFCDTGFFFGIRVLILEERKVLWHLQELFDNLIYSSF